MVAEEIIRLELDADPLGRGYAGMSDAETSDDLNLIYRESWPRVSASEILEAITASGWSGLDGQPGLPWALAGLGAGFGPMLVCWMAGGIGGGDAKLMGAIGALGGWRFIIAAMMYGFIIAAIMAVFVTVRKGVFRRTLRRIATAVALTFTPGVRPADPTSKDSPRIPFAVALCVGAVVAGIASFFKARLV